ncbi:hypothetical protein BEI46_08570 [Aliivibrio fischeri]|uniref:glycosyltransferase family 4 protein n=1 Tax=Aliivibrio fischeri TaxID=668 RepID=UPI00084BC8CA|nr:glycosyltransferase family 4 protein [Aliivibrio fischeri]OED56333.1 hypothetical protein BEI46_08570 [Aliivibrio fischeri]
MKNKIIIVVNTSWYAFNFYKELISFYISNDVDVYVVSPDSDYFLDLISLGVKVKRIQFSRRGLNVFSDFLFVFRLMLFYIKTKPLFVYNFTIKPNIWSGITCRFLNIPYVNTISGLGSSFISGGILRKITEFLYKLGCNSAVDNLVMNEDDLFKMRDIFNNKNVKLNKVSGTGIDLNNFRYVLPTISKEVRFLFVGRILKDKGILELIDAFSSIDDVNLVLDIVGDFDLGNPSTVSKKEFYEKINSDNRIFFHGYQKDIKKFIESANFVVLPSYREGLPRVLMESLSIGRPILASNVAGCRDLVSPETGFIFESMSSESLSICMRQVSSLKTNDYLKLCLSARKYAEKELNQIKVINHYYSYLQLNNS